MRARCFEAIGADEPDSLTRSARNPVFDFA